MMMMKSVRHGLVVGSVLAALAAGAFAQSQPPASAPQGPQAGARFGHHGPMNPAERQQHFAQRMDKLKTLLQLTPAQDSAWNTFTQAMQPSQQPHPPMDRQAMANMTTPQRIDFMRGLREQRMAEMNRRAEATKTFYAALNPQQQKAFDQITARGLRGHGHHRGGWGHHGERGERGEHRG